MGAPPREPTGESAKRSSKTLVPLRFRQFPTELALLRRVVAASGSEERWERTMGRYALLWLLGVPIPILLLIYLFGGLH